MTSARRMYVLCALALLLEACASFFLQIDVPRDGDITIHLNAAQRILAGEKLYRDIITASFPMQFYVRIPGVLLSQWFDLDIFTVAMVFDHLAALFSLALVLAIIKKTRLGGHPAIFPFLTVILGCVMFVLPAYQRSMGEKEYFFWLFTLPYFILAAAQTDKAHYGRKLKIAVGVFAAIGFCYKPFFILPLLFVETYLCWHSRTGRTLLRTETLSCAAVGIVYLAWMLAYFPEYRTVVLPIGHYYYDAAIAERAFLIRHYCTRLLPFVVAAFGLWAYFVRKVPALTPFFTIFSLATLGYALACLIQMKGFFSHLFPTLAMTITAFAFAAAFTGVLHPKPQDSASRGGYAVIFLALLSLMAFAWYTPPTSPKTVLSSEAILDRSFAIHNKINPGEPFTVYLFSAQLSPIFPHGIYRGVPWDYHFYHLWLLDGIANFRKQHSTMPDAWLKAKTRASEIFLRNTVTDDLERLNPAVLLVDRRTSLDFINYFSQQPRFAELIKNYTFQNNFYEIDVYTRDPPHGQ